jgi:hypothetical protein
MCGFRMGLYSNYLNTFMLTLYFLVFVYSTIFDKHFFILCRKYFISLLILILALKLFLYVKINPVDCTSKLFLISKSLLSNHSSCVKHNNNILLVIIIYY